MGSEAEFHFGKKRSRDGLEFVAGRHKRASFNTRPEARSERPADHLREMQSAPPEQPTYAPLEQKPAEAMLPVEVPEDDPLAHIYQEPQLSSDVTDLLFDEEEDVLQAPAAQKVEVDPAIELHDEKPVKPSAFRRILSYVVALVALVVIGLSALFFMHHTPNISASEKSKVGTQVYDIMNNPNFKLDKKSVQVSNEGSLIYFVDNKNTKAHFIISQQKIPDIVKNETEYQQFLSEFDKYAEFSSKIGKAYFTRPANIGSDISVVVKTDTTILFIRGPGAAQESEWIELLGYFKAV